MRIHGLNINQTKSPFAEYFEKDFVIKVKKYQRGVPTRPFYICQ